MENLELFEPNARSNFPHKHPLVIQAWDSSLGQWLDTIHGNINLPACAQYSVPIALEPHRWMQGKPGKIRIVHRKSAA